MSKKMRSIIVTFEQDKSTGQWRFVMTSSNGNHLCASPYQYNDRKSAEDTVDSITEHFKYGSVNVKYA